MSTKGRNFRVLKGFRRYRSPLSVTDLGVLVPDEAGHHSYKYKAGDDVTIDDDGQFSAEELTLLSERKFIKEKVLAK